MLTDFQNSFAGRLSGKSATNSYLNIPPHPKYVAKLPCVISIWKNLHAQEVTEANCHVRLSLSKNCFKYLFSKIFIIWFTNKKDVHTSLIKFPLSTVHCCCNKEKDVAAKCHTLSAVGQLLMAEMCRSVSQNWSTAVWYLLIINSHSSAYQHKNN